MKNKILNIIGIIAVVTTATYAYFYTREHTMTAGIKHENMDTSINPGDNFFDYATLGWRRANPIPDDYVRYGSFEVLNDVNLKRVREIAENDNGKIGTLYKLAMDTDKLNADGVDPVKDYINAIDTINTRDQLPQFLGKFHTYAAAFWGDGVGLDEMDSEHYIYVIGQGGTGLSRDYYFDNDKKSIEIRKKYREYITNQMGYYGIAVDTDKLFALEKRMAKSFTKKEDLRDPRANYHKMTIDELVNKIPNFDWCTYLSARGAGVADVVNVMQPAAIAESVAILNDTDMDLIKTYLKYRIVLASQSILDENAYDTAFDFFNRTMAGQKEKKPHWKRAVSLLDDSLGEEIGQLYVDKYFPAAAKRRMEIMVKNLKRALGMRIENLTWMSDETRTRAMEKLNTFHAKIGYPDVWRDASKLHIDGNDTLWENMVRVSQFEDDFWLAKIGTKRDPNIWYMNAHEINAYYDPTTNEICFPAGILQYPFFDMDADDAFNYGAIGSIIGHEMTHGYDDSGRHFDADGNMRDWWTADDATAFDTRAGVMREYFDKIEIAPGVHANGTFTLGENLADYGGVTVSYTAYKTFGTPVGIIDGFSDDMRFFIAYAGTWAGDIRDDAALQRTKTDVHSLAINRVNGILPHIDAWYDAFKITSSDKLYITPEKRVKIW